MGCNFSVRTELAEFRNQGFATNTRTRGAHALLENPFRRLNPSAGPSAIVAAAFNAWQLQML